MVPGNPHPLCSYTNPHSPCVALLLNGVSGLVGASAVKAGAVLPLQTLSPLQEESRGALTPPHTLLTTLARGGGQGGGTTGGTG